MKPDQTRLDKIKKQLAKFEPRRKSLTTRVYILRTLIVLISLPLAFYLMKEFDQSMLSIIVFFAAFRLMSMIRRFVYQDFKRDYKTKIVDELIKMHYPTLQYRPEDYVNQAIFANSFLFSDHVVEFEGEDLIQGKIGDTQFQLSQLHVKREIDDYDSYLFKGLFIEADFHKYFHSETFILPKSPLSAVGMHKRKHNEAELTQLEDPHFEDVFSVFTTDEQDARYLLSATFMERLTNLQRKFNCDVSFSFRGSNIYIAIETGHLGYFNHDPEEPIHEQVGLKMIIDEIHLVLSVIDDLNLNTRIWSKMPLRQAPQLRALDDEDLEA